VSPPPTTGSAEPLIDGNVEDVVAGLRLERVLPATTPGTKSPSITIAAFGGSEKTFATEVGKSVCSAPDVPPAMLSVSPTTFGHRRQRVLDRLVGPLDLVLRQLVVLLRPGRAEVDVLEQVGERPAVGAADRVRRDARRLDRLRAFQNSSQVFGALTPAFSNA
jgi:hypothetical protein